MGLESQERVGQTLMLEAFEVWDLLHLGCEFICRWFWFATAVPYSLSDLIPLPSVMAVYKWVS